ncbi:hypothetical protein KQX54_020761 [Cotesia glomerata]|uniref:Uncharacterized protein n=1 Tax=Cotesia glomerata TaxID=32391 RepID=A0AAV7I2A1_COTGL|nr:hypothetical protein KQX54_020761 [Cotesia glomerata]
MYLCVHLCSRDVRACYWNPASRIDFRTCQALHKSYCSSGIQLNLLPTKASGFAGLSNARNTHPITLDFYAPVCDEKQVSGL